MTMTASPVQSISAWITKNGSTTITVYPGNFRTPRDVMRVRVYRYEAFNSNGTDLLDIGYTGDTDAYANDVDLAGTGLATVTLGSGVGFDATPREIVLTYTASGSAPTTGKALVIIEFVPSPLLP